MKQRLTPLPANALSVALAAALSLAAALAPLPLRAEEETGELREGFSLIEEGAKLLLRGLAEEVQPMMKSFGTEVEPKLRSFGEDMAPLLEHFGGLVENLDAYHPPERLPNGDIILRRKAPQEADPPAGHAEIDL